MEPSVAYLDHFQTEQFGLYWRHYPNIGLNSGLFYNLMIYDSVTLQEASFYPDSVSNGPHKNEFTEFERLRKVEFISDHFRENERDLLFRHLTAPQLNGLNVPDFEDVMNFIFCMKNSIPFSISDRRRHDIAHIASLATSLESSGPATTPAIENQATARIAEWLVDVEMPALAARSEKMREDIFKTGPHLVAVNSDGSVEKDFTKLLLASHWYDLQQSLFISPEELVKLLQHADDLKMLRAKVRTFSESVASRAALADELKQYHDTLNSRLGKSDFVFAGINVGFTWVPFSSVATTPAQLGLNKYIKSSFNWLLFLNRINKIIRTGQGDGHDG